MTGIYERDNSADNLSPHCSAPRQNITPFRFRKMKGVVLLNNVFGEIRDRVSMQDVAKFRLSLRNKERPLLLRA